MKRARGMGRWAALAALLVASLAFSAMDCSAPGSQVTGAGGEPISARIRSTGAQANDSLT